jgi:hypothetical protein
MNANAPQFVTTFTVYVRLGLSVTFGGGTCCGPLGAGTGTVRQPAGEADVEVEVEPPAAAGLVVDPAAVLLDCELGLVLLPQPAAPRTITRARHALRTGSKQSRSPHCEKLNA